MTGTWWLVRRQLRRRWVAVVPLALIVTLGATGTLVAAGAADRTSSAYDRYLERADVSDVVLNPALATTEIDRVVRHLPGVRAITSDAFFFVTADDGHPRQAAELAAEMESGSNLVQVLGSYDGRYTVMDRPVVHEGRMPTGRNEMLVDEALAEAEGIEVGEVTPLAFWDSTADPTLGGEGVVSPAGVERVTVVGIATLPDEVLPDDLYPRQRAVVSPDLAERYDCVPDLPSQDVTPGEVVPTLLPSGCARSYRYYALSLEDGARGVGPALDAFVEQSARLNERLPEAVSAVAGYYLIATPNAAEKDRVERSLQPTVTALTVLALAAGVVTLVVLGLAVARELRRTGDDQRQWWQLGLTAGERTIVTLVPPLLALAAGLVLAVALAWALSPVAPVGSVRSIEPSPARSLSGWVVGWALGLAALAVVGVAALALRAARRSGRPFEPPPSRRDLPVVRRLVGGTSRPDVGEGVRAAYGGSPGAGVVVASCALAAGVFVAALVFGASLSSVLSTPASYGWPWDLAIMGGGGYGELQPDAIEDALSQRDDVTSWTMLGLTNDVTVDGEPVVSVIAASPRPGVDFTVVSGRLPRTADEVALGTLTASERGVGVGDHVELGGSVSPQRATVTGLAVLPPLGPFQADRAEAGTGMVLPASALDPDVAAPLFTFVGMDLAPGADPAAVFADVRDDFGSNDGTLPTDYRTPVRPAEIVSVRSMRAAPLLVGGLLAGSAVVGLAVAILVSIRSRRRELAILRALGFTGRQVRTSIRVQAVATMVAALAIGVPLGVALGRVAWRAFAFRLGVAADPSTPLWWIAATVAGSVALAAAVAIFPARLAARINPAAALRTE